MSADKAGTFGHDEMPTVEQSERDTLPFIADALAYLTRRDALDLAPMLGLVR